MIDLVWFEQFENFNSFHFDLRHDDTDFDDFSDLIECCAFLSFSYSDSYAFIADFINLHFFVLDFDFTIKGSNLNLFIRVEAV